MDGSCSDDSEIEEERACGGPGPTGGGPEQEDRGRIRADDVYLECWRSTVLALLEKAGNVRRGKVENRQAYVLEQPPLPLPNR